MCHVNEDSNPFENAVSVSPNKHAQESATISLTLLTPKLLPPSTTTSAHIHPSHSLNNSTNATTTPTTTATKPAPQLNTLHSSLPLITYFAK
jgi:hypothetical protein